MDRFRSFVGFGPRQGEKSSTGSKESSSKEFPYAKDVKIEMNEKAQLYRVAFGPPDPETGEQKCHSLLKIPSFPTRIDMMEKRLARCEREQLMEKERNSDFEWTYNICMLDVSGSMRGMWQPFVQYWNQYIKNLIDGSVDVYTFDDRVRYIHDKPYLKEGYYSGHGTSLSGALAKISHLVNGCPHKHVRVFLVTDGRDSMRDKDPINSLKSYIPRHNKRIDVYVLGIGHDFPVEISVDLRSRLHSGPTYCPTLFWAKSIHDLESEMQNLAESITPSIFVRLSKPAIMMPGLREKWSTVYTGDYLYFEEDPEKLKKTLTIVCEDEPKVKFDADWKRNVDSYRFHGEYRDYYDFEDRMYSRMMMMDRHMFMRYSRPRGAYDEDEFYYDGRRDEDRFQEYCITVGLDSEEVKRKAAKMSLPPNSGKRAILNVDDCVLELTPRKLLDDVFKQWGSVILQRTKLGQKVDPSIYEFMEKIFLHCANTSIPTGPKNVNESIQARLVRKSKGTLITEFKEFVNGVKGTSDIDAKFSSEVEHANAVLKTTVSTKYDNQALRVKGYSTRTEWDYDMRKFLDEYNKIKGQIIALPTPSPEDSCRILLTSFLADLQDSSNFETLARSGKLNFLQEMTFSGVPVFSPIKDSTQMNPWTIQIRNIINSPYEILCQRILEDFQSSSYKSIKAEKSIFLKGTDKRTKFNLIVPIVPREYTELLKPLLTSTVFAVACSYCILKNANILDRNCHLAALGCVWMRCVRDFPIEQRPEYIRNRILNIEANAKVYLDRKTVAAYIECLFTLPYRALQTESETPFNDVKIKCESILKPCFLLHLVRNDMSLIKKHKANLPGILRSVLMEFLGRCVSHYKSDTPFVDFFLPQVESSSRQLWLNQKCDELYRRMGVSGPELFAKYSDLSALNKFINKSLAVHMKDLEEDLSWQDLVSKDDDWCIQSQRLPPTTYYSSDDYGMSDSEDENGAAFVDDDEPRTYDQEDDGICYDEDEEVIVKHKTLMPSFAKIEKLRHSGNAGQIDWNDLKAWAQEMLANLGPQTRPNTPPGAVGGAPGNGPGDEPMQTDVSEKAAPEERPVCLIQEDIDFAFGIDNVTLYLCHALRYRDSRTRLLTPMDTPEEGRRKVEEAITVEWKKIVSSELRPMLSKRLRDQWMESYKEAHKHLAKPLSRQTIIRLATERGIPVTEENFHKVYRYNPSSGLCRNACQVEQCHYFLQPNRRMNAHLEPERRDMAYPHTLHLMVSSVSDDAEETARKIAHGHKTGTKGRRRKMCDGPMRPIISYVEELKQDYEKMNNS